MEDGQRAHVPDIGNAQVKVKAAHFVQKVVVQGDVCKHIGKEGIRVGEKIFRIEK
jgi:hypothetical protein